jgi:Circadian oscillating protein COP23
MMNLKSSTILTSVVLCLIGAGLPPVPTTLAQETVEFYCGRTENQEPATVLGVRGKPKFRTVVIWRKSFGQISAEKRCRIISDRFEEGRKNKQFDLLIAGRDKTTGQGLICAIKHGEKICDSKHLLFSVNNQAEAKEIVQGLYSSMRKNGKPVPQSSSSESIDIQELIDSIDRNLI